MRWRRFTGSVCSRWHCEESERGGRRRRRGGRREERERKKRGEREGGRGYKREGGRGGEEKEREGEGGGVKDCRHCEVKTLITNSCHTHTHLHLWCAASAVHWARPASADLCWPVVHPLSTPGCGSGADPSPSLPKLHESHGSSAGTTRWKHDARFEIIPLVIRNLERRMLCAA